MNTKPLNWSPIDTAQPECFIDYLDTATAQAEMQRYKQKTYELLGATPGAFLLDVGCGTGDDALALAERVSPNGKVIGLDYSASLIEKARQRVQSGDLPLTFQVGDVHHLKFADNSFDGCRADRVFMHNASSAYNSQPVLAIHCYYNCSLQVNKKQGLSAALVDRKQPVYELCADERATGMQIHT